jgi:hypothetical protein
MPPQLNAKAEVLCVSAVHIKPAGRTHMTSGGDRVSRCLSSMQGRPMHVGTRGLQVSDRARQAEPTLPTMPQSQRPRIAPRSPLLRAAIRDHRRKNHATALRHRWQRAERTTWMAVAMKSQRCIGQAAIATTSSGAVTRERWTDGTMGPQEVTGLPSMSLSLSLSLPWSVVSEDNRPSCPISRLLMEDCVQVDHHIAGQSLPPSPQDAPIAHQPPSSHRCAAVRRSAFALTFFYQWLAFARSPAR